MIALLALTLLPAPSALPMASAMPSMLLLQDADLKADFKKFEGILKSKENEGEAINMMDAFVNRYRMAQTRIEAIEDSIAIGEGDTKELGKEKKVLLKEQAALAKEVALALSHKSRKAMTEANFAMWRAAAYSLGQMGSPGAHWLWKTFEAKKFKDEPDFRGLCLEQIGYTHAYEDFAEELIDLLDHHEYLFIAKASDALAQFGEAPGSIRKEAVERFVNLMGQNWEATISDQKDEEAQRKYRKTGSSMRAALEAMTGTSQDDPQAWTRWWNKNKNKKENWAD